MPLFSIPLSGLSSTSDALSVISNNLANLNTTGYKGQNATFRDLYYQALGTSGSGNPLQVGGGAAVSSITTNFNDGNTNPTGVSTDVAIKGNGFFVTEDDGVRRYSRDGHFDVNDEGNLITENGQLVMGYLANNGVVSPTQGLSAIPLSRGLTTPASPTSLVNMKLNLNADSSAAWSTPVTVYDSLGNDHVLKFSFQKTATDNQWSFKITMPKEDFQGSLASDPVLSQGLLQFDGAGKLTQTGVGSGTPTLGTAADVTGITTTTALADGANALNFSWQLLDSNNNPMLTQAAAAFGASNSYQNGYQSGTLTDYSFSNDGMVQAKFSNGKTIAVAQLALATFANNQGLERAGGNSFNETLASGVAVIGVPGSGGRGELAGSSLELSNVDMSKEFSNLIVTQRAFQANARVITTFDQVTQETINLKQG